MHCQFSNACVVFIGFSLNTVSLIMYTFTMLMLSETTYYTSINNLVEAVFEPRSECKTVKRVCLCTFQQR